MTVQNIENSNTLYDKCNRTEMKWSINDHTFNQSEQHSMNY